MIMELASGHVVRRATRDFPDILNEFAGRTLRPSGPRGPHPFRRLSHPRKVPAQHHGSERDAVDHERLESAAAEKTDEPCDHHVPYQPGPDDAHDRSEEHT